MKPVIRKTTSKGSLSIAKPTKKNDGFSADYVIDAYEKGHRNGFNEATGILLNTFRRNINDASRLIGTILGLMHQYGISYETLYIRADLMTIEIIIAMQEQEYLNDQLRSVYELIAEHEASVEEFMTLSISLLPLNASFDENIITSDGFINFPAVKNGN